MQYIAEDYEVDKAITIAKSQNAQVFKVESKHMKNDMFAIKQVKGWHLVEMLKQEYTILQHLRGSGGLISEAVLFKEDTESRVPTAILGSKIARFGDIRRLVNIPMQDTKDFYFRVILAANMARSLEFVHARGILHLDVKPDNFFLETDKVMLADFGISTQIECVGMGHVQGKYGTQGYRCPAFLKAERSDYEGTIQVTIENDLYAFAVTLYELFYGERPLDYEEDLTELEVTEKIQKHGVRGPEDLRCEELDNLLNAVFQRRMTPRQFYNDIFFHQPPMDFSIWQAYNDCYPDPLPK